MELVYFHYWCVGTFLLLPTVQAYDFTGINENSAPTPVLARLNGYHCDVHTVTTEDGYVLQLHRIPGSRTYPLNCSLPPVLLIHGNQDSSSTWLIAGPTQALAYLLADQGYDVWLGNLRGNIFGRGNIHFNVLEDLFWDFSWEEAGIFDLPAIIDYVLNITEHPQLLYVGHSMGTTAFFVLLTIKPEYNNKVQHMVALSPAVTLTRAPEGIPLVVFENIHTYGELLPKNSMFNNMLQYFCAIEANNAYCTNLLFSLFGYDPIGFNETLIPIIFGHFPSGGSNKIGTHYNQVICQKRFQRFDYGPVKNLAKYNSTIPPKFDLYKVSVSLSLFYSDNDAIVHPEDVMNLVSQLKTEVDLYRVNLTTFNHIDFTWGKNLKELVNDKVISILKAKQILSSNVMCVPRQ